MTVWMKLPRLKYQGMETSFCYAEQRSLLPEVSYLLVMLEQTEILLQKDFS